VLPARQWSRCERNENATTNLYNGKSSTAEHAALESRVCSISSVVNRRRCMLDIIVLRINI